MMEGGAAVRGAGKVVSFLLPLADADDCALCLRVCFSLLVPLSSSGGAIDQGENINQAAEREVKEETGVDVDFRCLIGFRHLLNFRFGTGDLYFIAICTLKDEARFEPTPQPEEISQCKWWDVQEFLQFHSSRWMQDLIREPVLQEWHRAFPNSTLPPAPSAERAKELATMPPHPKKAEGQDWPAFDMPQPPPAGGSVGMPFTVIGSVLGKTMSNFYVVAPPPAVHSASASAGGVSKL